jgi:glucan phosphoethanolaminetransferase (alkaline phosphatase superfamily)
MKEKSFKLVKKTQLTKHGIDAFWFSRDPEGDIVTGSLSYTEETARQFFEKLVDLNGETTKEEVILEVPSN